MSTVDAHACTDVTGFGLVGHLRNVRAASKHDATLFVDAMPVLEAARRYVGGDRAGRDARNRRFLADRRATSRGVTKEDELLLATRRRPAGCSSP